MAFKLKLAAALFILASAVGAQGLRFTSIAGTSSTIATTSLGATIKRSNSGVAMTDTLPSASAVGAGWQVTIINADSSATDTINSVFALLPGQAALFFSDGSQYQALFGMPTVSGPATVTTLTASGLITTTNGISATQAITSGLSVSATGPLYSMNGTLPPLNPGVGGMAGDATNGAIIGGSGSANDVQLQSSTGSNICSVVHNSGAFTCTGNIKAFSLYIQPFDLSSTAIPQILVPSGYMDAVGNLVLGQHPASAATVTFSGTSGSVTATYSAGTPLSGDTDAHDVGRQIVVLDGSTYKWCSVTAHVDSTHATCSLNTTTTAGAYANAANWLGGSLFSVTNAAGADAVVYSAPLDSVYSSGFFAYLPASAPPGSAAMYYCVGASVAVATCYNSTYSGSGKLIIPGSPAAFSGLTPGVYTQTTGAYLSLESFPLPNSLGLNGTLDADASIVENNSAGSKAMRLSYGGSTVGSTSQTTAISATMMFRMTNAGNTSVQYAGTSIGTPGGRLAVDSTATQNLVWQLNLAVATDWIAIERYSETDKPIP